MSPTVWAICSIRVHVTKSSNLDPVVIMSEGNDHLALSPELVLVGDGQDAGEVVFQETHADLKG